MESIRKLLIPFLAFTLLSACTSYETLPEGYTAKLEKPYRIPWYEAYFENVVIEDSITCQEVDSFSDKKRFVCK